MAALHNRTPAVHPATWTIDTHSDTDRLSGCVPVVTGGNLDCLKTFATILYLENQCKRKNQKNSFFIIFHVSHLFFAVFYTIFPSFSRKKYRKATNPRVSARAQKHLTTQPPNYPTTYHGIGWSEAGR